MHKKNNYCWQTVTLKMQETAETFRVGSLCSLLPLSTMEDYQFLRDTEEGS